MKLRCYLLSLLRIHRSDCPDCNARETCGDEMRKRLEELNWPTHFAFTQQWDQERKVVEVLDCPSEIASLHNASTTQRQTQRQKIT
jgi:hypothetical protein